MPAERAGAPLTLALDASTYAGSVALLRGDAVLAERSVAMRGEREERLMPAVADAMREAGVAMSDLERVVCGAGPGSFTSLRIAASIAKGIAQGAGVPLLAVSSLVLVVAGASAALAPGLYLAGLDAMRGECYAALVGVEGPRSVRELSVPRIVSAAALPELAAGQGAQLVGPQWTAAGSTGALHPRAVGVAALADGPSLRRVDLGTWEPDYGRLAEAQVKWEAAHGRSLSTAGP